ncbi:MAG: primosomal protein N', partial [Anaerolineales bacterium]|nr:primosomal protein N' [Anaerolineales bacterium]
MSSPVYVEVAVNFPQVAEMYDYHLPEELVGNVAVGQLVVVPFGSKYVQGVIVRYLSHPSIPETKPVSSLIEPETSLTSQQIELAQAMARSNLSPLAGYINLMLPPGLSQYADVVYERPSTLGPPVRIGDVQKRLLSLLDKRGALRGRQIDRALPRTNWRGAARGLITRELITTRPVLPAPTVKPRAVRTATLACPPSVAEDELPKIGRAGSAAFVRRQKIVAYLIQQTGPVEVSWVYAESGGNLSDLRKLADMGLVTLGETEVWRDPVASLDFLPSEPPPLTRDQHKCWQEIEAGLNATSAGKAPKPYLLHGVTGSGKTEVYLHAVESVLSAGKQAIVLVPEIALTPQTLQRFAARFPGQVGLLHSRLSDGERYDTWRRARAGQISIVVGPRSALFTPFANLGLIVLDECHDHSYYQSEPPFYHALDTAIDYAHSIGAVCVFGSATPSVSSIYLAERGKWNYLRLPARIMAHRQRIEHQTKYLQIDSRYADLEEQAQFIDLPQVDVVDMRAELKAGNRSIFSRTLQHNLAQVLKDKRQAILFLNRRGTATYVFCRDCGYTLRCSNCDTPLTYHARQQHLTCHYCNYSRKMPKTCPECRGERIRQYGMGTERVEAELQSLFPEVRTLRWDYETTRKKGAHEIILEKFSAQHADILVGTQMLAKGLDLPFVTLVGVVLADVGLNFPDYSAAERVFQVLTQVAGRAGRSPLGGK